MTWVVRAMLAIPGGYVATAIGVMIVVALASALFGGNGRAPTRAYLVANIIGSFAAAIVGGFVAALIGGSPALLYGGLLALALIVVGIAMVRFGPEPGQPAWYPWIIPLVGAAGALAGSLLRA